MSDHNYQDSCYFGIDIGTSTSQGYAGRQGVQSVALSARVGSHYVDDYPSAIAEIGPGEYVFGGQALRAAHQPGVQLHRHFKAYLNRSCPLTGPYDQKRAAELFVAFAVHLIGLYGDRILAMVHQTGRSRVELCLTLPAGWRVDPETDDLFCSVIAEIMERVLNEVGDDITIVPRMVEEPVAGLLGLQADHRIASGHTLVIDAGGGTLDAAVCSSNGESSLDAFCVQLCRSIAEAGAATVEAFVDMLSDQGAFSPPISQDVRQDPRFMLQLEEIFQEVSGAYDDEHVKWLEVGATRFEVNFSIRETFARLAAHDTLAAQAEFLRTLLPEFRKRIGRTILGFDNVYLLGGLAQFGPFADLVREVFPEVVVVHNPQRRVAMGAMEYARLGGRQIEGRTPDYMLGERMKVRDEDRYVMVEVVPAGTPVSSDPDNPFEATGTCPSLGRFGTGSFDIHVMLAWTHSRDPADMIKTIFEDTITMPVRMVKGDVLRTLLWFDEMLRIRFTILHERSGATWTSTAPLSWGI